MDSGACLLLQTRGIDGSHAVITHVLPLNTLRVSVRLSEGPQLALQSGRSTVTVRFETHDDCRQCADALEGAITDHGILETQRLGALLADRCPLPRKYKDSQAPYTPTAQTPTTLEAVSVRSPDASARTRAEQLGVHAAPETSEAGRATGGVLSPLRPSEVSPLQEPASAEADD